MDKKLKDTSLRYAKENKRSFLQSIISGKRAGSFKEAIFMAGSPGAGKTEVAEGFLQLNSNLVIIDADQFRSQFPDYNGKNSTLFQRGSAFLVDYCYTEVLKNSYSFVLDSTFAISKAKNNVERALNRNYDVSIFYVYQEPMLAWKFTKDREKSQGRIVPKETFINAYLNSRKNIIDLKTELEEKVAVHVVFKDYENNVSDIQFDIPSLDLVLPKHYSKTELERLLNDYI
ncbi:zeta toxin family protein [Streptococcus merionis]|uniref:zeta toxin family protein n=1 Tax=Streptococcus merionis TaxID=400065 RepID=UPI0035167310